MISLEGGEPGLSFRLRRANANSLRYRGDYRALRGPSGRNVNLFFLSPIFLKDFVTDPADTF